MMHIIGLVIMFWVVFAGWQSIARDIKNLPKGDE